MELAVLIIIALLLLLFRIPIGIALFLAMIAVVIKYGTTTLIFLCQQMYTGLESIPLVAVPCFMLAGSFMESGGLSRRLIDVATKLTGHTTGGLGTVTILACLFFGAISGSAPATAAAIGGIMIPFMVKQGYDRAYAGGLNGVAGALGIIVPPSIPMVLYGVSTSTNIGSLFIAGFIPAILIAVFLMATHNIISKRSGYVNKLPKASGKEIWRAVWDAKWALLMPVIILGGIYGGFFTPTEAAVVAVVYGIIIGLFVYKELKPRDIFGVFEKTGSRVGGFMLTFAPAAALGVMFVFLGLPDIITNALLSVTTNIYIILLILNIFLLLMGMILDCVSCIIVFAPVLYAVLVNNMGLDPVHLGIIIVVNLAVGFITPPVCMNLFVITTMTGDSIEKVAKKALPLIVATIGSVLVITFIPGLSVGLLWLIDSFK
jgi:C4-dicarboxylate transporter DctM subunit